MILVWVVAVCVGRERIIDWGLTSASAVPGPPWLLVRVHAQECDPSVRVSGIAFSVLS